MLSEDALDKLMQPIIDRQTQIDIFVISTIAQRINEIGKMLPSDIKKLERILKMGGDVRKINKEIARLTGLNEKAIKQLIRNIAQDAYIDVKPYYDYRHKSYIPFIENIALQHVVKSIERQTLKTYRNLSNSTGFMIRDLKHPKILKPTSISKTYQSVLDEAIQASQSGIIDYNTAMRRTLKQLVDSGIRNVTYNTESGRTYTQRLDTAVRRNLLDGIRQLNQGVQDEVGKQFGADGKEITVHAFSAPDHEPIQGHQFSNEEYENLQEHRPFKDYAGKRFAGIERSIGTWNCRHFTFSIVLGYAQPNYTEEQLDEMKKNNAKGVTINGKHFTMYEVTQLMREIETNIRRCKEGVIAAKEAGNAELASEYRQKVKQYRNQYDRVCEISGLSPRPDKMRVAGYK